MARGSAGGGSRGRGFSRFGYRGSTHFRGGRGRGRGRGRGGAGTSENRPQREDDGTQMAERFEQVRLQDEVDEKMGFARVSEGLPKEGWLVNMHPVCVVSQVVGLCWLIFWIGSGKRPGVSGRESCGGLLFYSRRWRDVQVHVPIRAVLLHRMQGV